MTPAKHYRRDMTPCGEGICNCGLVTEHIDEHVAVFAARDDELNHRVTIPAEAVETGDELVRIDFTDGSVLMADPPVEIVGMYEHDSPHHKLYLILDNGTELRCRGTEQATIETTRQFGD